MAWMESSWLPRPVTTAKYPKARMGNSLPARIFLIWGAHEHKCVHIMSYKFTVTCKSYSHQLRLLPKPGLRRSYTRIFQIFWCAHANICQFLVACELSFSVFIVIIRFWKTRWGNAQIKLYNKLSLASTHPVRVGQVHLRQVHLGEDKNGAFALRIHLAH